MIFTILKVIGIILLVVLALILAVVLCVLFVPVKYRAVGSFDNTDIRAKAHVSWLLHLFALHIEYARETDGYIRLAFVKKKLFEDSDSDYEDYEAESDYENDEYDEKPAEFDSGADNYETLYIDSMDDDAKAEMLKKGKITNTELTFTHKAREKLYDLSEEYESNGTMRFLGMAVILNFLLKKNKFVPIDEVETSIHYELLAYFIKVFLANSDGTSQMLLTTHDINLLNEEFIRRDTIWFTDKDEQGETKVFRLSSLGLHKNLSPYNAYKQGKLVKLPFLGSQYFNLNE